ncbi:hypothetical protein [Bradyrhizobium sp. UFLA01-814]
MTLNERLEATRRKSNGEQLGNIARAYNVSEATISRLTVA